MNVELLKKVRNKILGEPQVFSMANWIADLNGFDAWDTDQVRQDCETTACIAGWTVILGIEEAVPYQEIQYKATKLLKLTHEQAYKLFFVNGWEEKIQCRYTLAKTAKGKALIAAEAIDKFIEQNSK